ncbi:MAG: PQQ-dependent sugar dehydrogenase [Pseudomonadota bacterium]
MLYRLTFISALTTGLLCAGALQAQVFETSVGEVSVEKVADGFEHPWALAFVPNEGLLVTERPGRLQFVVDGVSTEVSGLPDIREIGQGGLLDVVVSEDFADTGLIFLTYSEPAPGRTVRTAAARARLALDGLPRLEDLEVIFRMEPATSGGRHFGSRIVLADDGTLLITTGDRGERDPAQDLNSHIGKTIRINRDGSVPADNPFANGGGLPEIWSYGHRNPQGAAKRPSDGSYWTIEHGARGGDEVNRPEAGKNYGWPVISYGRHYSGFKIGVGAEAPGMEQPEYYWDPSIAPSGAAFYDGDLFPNWRGDLFVGALKFQLISRLEIDGDRIVGEERLFTEDFGRIRDVRSGPDGALWVLTDDDPGAVYRVTPAN